MNKLTTKMLGRLLAIICCIAMICVMMPTFVYAASQPVNATVNLITFPVADPTQDYLRISVNGESGNTWITIAIFNPDDRLVAVYENKANEQTVFDFNLSPLSIGDVAEVHVAVTRPGESSVKAEPFEREYYSFSQQQEAIANMMNPDVLASDLDAKKLSIDTTGDYALLTEEGKLFAQGQLALEYEGQVNISVADFQASVDAKIKLGLINSGESDIIAMYIEREKDNLSISDIPEYELYNEMSSAVKKSGVTDKLATGTYNNTIEFVEAFKTEVFLQNTSTLPSSSIVTYLEDNYANQSTNGVPFVLDFTTYDALDEVQKDYFATLIVNKRFESLSALNGAFNSALTTASTYEEPVVDPSLPPSNPVQDSNIGTVTGGTAGGSTGGAITPGAGAQTGNFNDISTVPWAMDAIQSLARDGIINGVGNDNFEPNGLVKREQFVKMIVGALGIAGDGDVSEFKDISPNEWYYGYLSAAISNGIINGTGYGSFGVGNDISRQDMSVIIYRAAQKTGVELPVITDDTPSDIESVADYAKEAVIALYKAGIINGVGDGRFAPNDSATRAQAAKIIYGVRGYKK